MAFEWHFATEKRINGGTTLEYKLEYFFFQYKFNANLIKMIGERDWIISTVRF